MKSFLVSAALIAIGACAPTEPCPWTTSTGRQSCGARPPARRVDPQRVARWLVQFEQPIRAQTDGAGTERALAWSNMPPIDLRDHMLQLSLRASQIAHAARFELVLGTDGFTDAFGFTLRSGQGQQWITDDRWVALSLSWSPNRVVGTPDRGRITDILLRVVDDATGVPVTIQLAGLGLVPEPVSRYPRGVLSFTFDDNHDTMITDAAPILDAYDFSATAYVIVEHVDTPARATLAQLQDRHARGWDIAAHSFSGAAHSMRWTSLPPTVLEDDIVDGRAWLMANGFTGYDHCAYPGGSFTGGDTDVLAIVDRYFTSCRTIYQRQREGAPPADAHKLRVFYVTNATTLDAAKHAVDTAVAAREWIILVFHRLVDTPVRSTEWSKADFAALVEHVDRSGIPVEPVTTVLDR